MRTGCVVLALATVNCALVGCGRSTREGRGGWYCAGSKQEDKEALGGFGPCDNYPKKCPDDTLDAEGRVSLVACPDEVVELGKYCVMPVRLVNRTKEVVAFAACDSHL